MVSLKILILDDEKVFREEIREFLENDDFTVLVAERPSEAFNILQNDSIDILLSLIHI